MNALEFLHLVLPDQGWYVGHASRRVPGQVKPVIRHSSFSTIEKLHSWLQVYERQGFDVYFAVASFELERVGTHRRSRANKPWLRILFADIDTRETHPDALYADQEEAARAVVAVCAVLRLPLPLWVSSGGGLHIYWVLDTEFYEKNCQNIYSKTSFNGHL